MFCVIRKTIVRTFVIRLEIDETAVLGQKVLHRCIRHRILHIRQQALEIENRISDLGSQKLTLRMFCVQGPMSHSQ